MTVIINDKTITLPSSKAEITLGRRIAFHREHGMELQKLHDGIKDMPEGEDKEVYARHFYYETIFRTVAFFLGTTAEAIKKSEFIDEAAKIYHSILLPLFDEDTEEPLQHTFQWMGHEWVLHSPELKYGSSMKFGELIDAKQTVKDIVTAGGSKWDYLLPISAIYLRKKDEEYQEEFLYDGSERLKLMEQLPVPIALQVGFFLSSTTSISMSILKYSGKPEQRVEVRISSHTLTAMGGSTF